MGLLVDHVDHFIIIYSLVAYLYHSRHHHHHHYHHFYHFIYQVGKVINIFGSDDVNRLVIKLNRKKNHLSSFVEWGYGELSIQDIHDVNHHINNSDESKRSDDYNNRNDDGCRNHHDDGDVKSKTIERNEIVADNKVNDDINDKGNDSYGGSDDDHLVSGDSSSGGGGGAASLMDNSDCCDVWIPVLRSTTGEQIGVMLLSAIRQHV